METQKNRINVLFINHSVRDGGPGRSLFYILKHIDRNSIRPFVLIPRDDLFSERLKEESIYNDVIVDSRFPDGLFRPIFGNFPPGATHGRGFLGSLAAAVLKTTYAAVNIAKLAALIFTCRSMLKKRRIDLIHCNGTIAKVTGALIGLMHGRPVVWHVRNIQQTRFLKLLITRLALLSTVKKIICVSQATAFQFGSNPKAVVIHNGIDPEDFDPALVEGKLRKHFGIPEGSILVGNVGRVVPRKGHEHMIQAAESLLKQEGFREKVRFVIVGDTPGFFVRNHLSDLKDMAASKGIAENFIFTGFRKDVAECLADFDIFLMPSNYPDPFPRAVIEAMSFAIPVVGFQVGGIEESVKNGTTGILSPPGNTADMTDAVRKLIQNKDLRKSMGAAGRQRVSELYSAKHKTAEVQSVLIEAVK